MHKIFAFCPYLFSFLNITFIFKNNFIFYANQMT